MFAFIVVQMVGRPGLEPGLLHDQSAQ
eukprot:COSAG06_NODE_52318_length_306_cov_1.000000_1_plen_26_part_10